MNAVTGVRGRQCREEYVLGPESNPIGLFRISSTATPDNSITGESCRPVLATAGRGRDLKLMSIVYN